MLNLQVVQAVLCKIVSGGLLRFSLRQSICNASREFGSDSSTFYHRDLEVYERKDRLPLPGKNHLLGFGKIYTDHMLEIDWTADNGWGKPIIKPFGPLSLHPACKALQYAVELFEGIKAFRGVDNKIRIFRIDQNMERMRLSAARAGLPDFDGQELQKLIVELVRLDSEWVPDLISNNQSPSLYLRPTLIATEPCLGLAVPQAAKLYVIMSPVDHYYGNRDEEISLLADSRYVRAFPGGVGAHKLACNYAPTVKISALAEELGCKQVLWLYGPDELLTEAGTMNIFIYWINEQGDRELLTPPLHDGLILAGVMRDTILQLANEWKDSWCKNGGSIQERYVSFEEVRRAILETRVLEMFGSGTAAVVTPIGRILHRKPRNGSMEELLIPTVCNGQNLTYKLLSTIRSIQRGKIERPEWITFV